jgi:bifunctional non-homologous end joining protein LigD
VYFAFDLLHVDGYDLRGVPLEQRKEFLQSLLADFDGPFVFISSFEGDGQAVFDEACRLGAEGIVSKRRGSAYRAGRTGAWLKTKCLQQGEFIVGGYTETTSPGEAFGALLVGEYAEDGRFHYVGRVGTGFSDKLRRELFQRLRPMEIDKCPFKTRPRTERKAYWVKPQMRIIARFTERTSDNKLRHPSYQGLAEKQP